MKGHPRRLDVVVSWAFCLLFSVTPLLYSIEERPLVPKPTPSATSSPDPIGNLEDRAPVPDFSPNKGLKAAEAAGETRPEDRRDMLKEDVIGHLQSAMILDYATFLVAVVTAVFAMFLAGLGFIEWRRFKELKGELAKEKLRVGQRIGRFRADLDAQRMELAGERTALETRVEAFKTALDAQEGRLAGNQRFIEAVLSHHSSLLVGIVEGFASSLTTDQAQRLRSLIFEAEAALDLFYPDKGEVLKALLRLEQIGADNSVSSLVWLRDDPAAAPDARIRAQEVLSKIVERLKKQRERRPVQALEDGLSRPRDGQLGLSNPPVERATPDEARDPVSPESQAASPPASVKAVQREESEVPEESVAPEGGPSGSQAL